MGKHPTGMKRRRNSKFSKKEKVSVAKDATAITKPNKIDEQQNEESSEDYGASDDMVNSDGDDEATTDSKIDIDLVNYFSSFHQHLGRIINNEEVDALVKQKRVFEWEIPSVSNPMSKWVGTGQQFEGFTDNYPVDVEKTLQKHWLSACENQGSDTNKTSRFHFLSLCNSYRDIMHCNKRPFYLKGSEDSNIMDAYLMHALNHVYKTKKLVTKNNEKLAVKGEGEGMTDTTYCDQGFTRPKVLILLPFASIALRVVKRLVQLTPLAKTATVGHLTRFMEEFGDDETDDKLEEEFNSRSANQKKPKPLDFQQLFGGNNNDHFRLGIKCTKRSMNLYSDFYSSDFIVASPLGLITKFGEVEADKEKDCDFLSSLEMVIVDHADIITMQNWDHVQTIFEQINRLPTKQHDTDWMRVRPWYLDGHSRFYRQTILLSSYLTPEINVLFNRLCVNYEGKVKLVTEHKGVLSKIVSVTRQVYERFAVSSVIDDDDVRFDYFCNKVYPKIKDSMEGVMLFISSHFEFLRLRNFLKSQNASFCILDEYTEHSDISRARLWFFEGKRRIIMYTERSHFYHRFKIRGVKNLIIYSLPDRKDFYYEIVNMLDESNTGGCSVFFSQFDYLKLERIVGTAAAKRMISSEKTMFVWC